MLAFHKHLLAETEALAAGSKVHEDWGNHGSDLGAYESAGSRQGPQELRDFKPPARRERQPRRRSRRQHQRVRERQGPASGSRSLCQFSHDWGTTPKAGRCLLCSGTGHMKKDCPTKDKSGGGTASRQKPESQPTSPTVPSPTNKALSTAPEQTSSSASSSQPAVEPSPGTSPSRVRPPEEDHPEALRKNNG